MVSVPIHLSTLTFMSMLSYIVISIIFCIEFPLHVWTILNNRPKKYVILKIESVITYNTRNQNIEGMLSSY